MDLVFCALLSGHSFSFPFSSFHFKFHNSQEQINHFGPRPIVMIPGIEVYYRNMVQFGTSTWIC